VFSLSKPRFFCEGCGFEVPRAAKDCPKCGKQFASVLCPACDFVGEAALFKGGCPICGYSSGVSPDNSGSLVNFPESKKPAGALPFWVYILTAAAFTGILAALFLAFF